MIEIMNLRGLGNRWKQNKWDMKVDRSSPVGNPYPIKGSYMHRDRVCNMYEKDFGRQMQNPYFEAYINSLINIYKRHGKLRLFCWCAPKRCHAETIKRFIENVVGTDTCSILESMGITGKERNQK